MPWELNRDFFNHSVYDRGMQVTDSLLPAYLQYIFAEDSPEQRLARLERWRKQVTAGERALADFFLSLSPAGAVNGAIYLTHLNEKTYAIQFPTQVVNGPVNAEDLAPLLKEALDRLRVLSADAAHVRLTENPHLLPLVKYFSPLGFSLAHTRIEFKAQVAELPTGEGGPLQWEPVGKRFTLEDAAKFLEQAGQGDPDWSEGENTLELLRSYLADPEFHSGLDCIQIGSLEEKVAAVVVAQVIPDGGWSRSTYMGMLPEFRGRGLGKWVHRQGFRMMKEKGGKLYQGGTVKGNAPMEALFRAHGCKEFRTMQEWIWKR